MCEISQVAWEGVPQGKLLCSFHRFLSCPVLGTGIKSEETSIRYTAFCFVLFFSLFFLPFFFFFPLLATPWHMEFPGQGSHPTYATTVATPDP